MRELNVGLDQPATGRLLYLAFGRHNISSPALDDGRFPSLACETRPSGRTLAALRPIGGRPKPRPGSMRRSRLSRDALPRASTTEHYQVNFHQQLGNAVVAPVYKKMVAMWPPRALRLAA